MKHRRTRSLTRRIDGRIFQLPGSALRIVFQARIVVSLVKVLEDTRQDFSLFIWEVDSFAGVWDIGINSGCRAGGIAALGSEERRGG